jgi:hypothetical protein
MNMTPGSSHIGGTPAIQGGFRQYYIEEMEGCAKFVCQATPKFVDAEKLENHFCKVLRKIAWDLFCKSPRSKNPHIRAHVKLEKLILELN